MAQAPTTAVYPHSPLRSLLRILMLVLVPLSASAADDNLLGQVAQRLTVFDHLEGQFTQSKQLGFMARPIVSKGTFSLSSEEGLRWLVEAPLRSEMTVYNTVVKLDGKPVEDRGIGQFMAQVMGAFMAGDLSALGKDFKASGEITAQGWQLHLVPASLLLRTVISHLELSGHHFLQSITIVENDAGGADASRPTQTLIEFRAVQGINNATQVQDSAGL